MSDNQTIFGRRSVAVKPKHFDAPKSDRKPRKKRSDAKHDIKFKLTANDRRILKLSAFDRGQSLTAFASFIVKKKICLDVSEIPNFEYDEDGQFVHVVLENDIFEMIKTLAIDWDLPFRRVVHRIIKEYIKEQTDGGFEIVTY